MPISSVGLGSGLDVKDIVAKLVALEQKPLAALQARASVIQGKMSAFAQLRAQIANLQDQVQKLTALDTWQARTLQSSHSALVTGSASGAAQPASFDVRVQQLAAAQSAGSALLPAGSTPGRGTLTITLGQWGENGSFTPNSVENGKNTATSIEIGAEDDDLAKIAAKINAADAGVSASVLRDHQGERLVLQSSRTGADAGFRVDVQEDAAHPGLARFALNDLAQESGAGLVCTQKAQDTLAHINGMLLASRDATFRQLAEGVDLTVHEANPQTSVRVTVAQDAAPARAALRDFVQSYNALSSAMRTMTAYDPESKTAGTLQGESSITGLQNALRRLLHETPKANGADAHFTHLSQIGLEFQTDGTLSMHDAKLDKALQQPQELARWFAADLPGQDQDGLAVRLKTFTEGLLASDGLFAGKDSSIKQTLKRNQQDQERQAQHVLAYENRLLAQYTRLDAQMGTLNALDRYIQQQVAQWNRAAGRG